MNKNTHRSFWREISTKIWCGLILLLLPLASLPAQDYTIELRSWGIEDGLLERKINNLFQDRDGFMWLLFDKGIQRFDGHEFTTWTKVNAGKKVTENYHAFQDSTGIIWFDINAFYDPLARKMMGPKEMFQSGAPFFGEDGNPIIESNYHIRFFGYDGEAMLFTRPDWDRLYRYHPQDGFSAITFKRFPHLGANLSFIDKHGFYWIGQDSSYCKVDEKGIILAEFPVPPKARFEKVTEEKHGVEIRFIYPKERTHFKHYVSESNQVSPTPYFPVDSTAKVPLYWTKEGETFVLKEQLRGPALASIPHKFAKDYLGGTNQFFVEIGPGNFWAFAGFGLVQVRANKRKFRQLLKDEENLRGFRNSTREIIQLRDTLYVAVEKRGVAVLPQTNPSKAFIHQLTKKRATNYPRGLANVNDELYIGSAEAITSFHNDYSYYADDHLKATGDIFGETWTMYCDEMGTLWVGTNRRKLMYQLAGTKSFTEVTVSDNIPDKKASDIPHHIDPGEDGQLWVSRGTGLFLLDTQQKRIIAHYGSNEPPERWLPTSYLYYHYADAEGVRWLGSSEGLIRWDTNTGDKRLFTRLDGLSDNVIYAIYEDNHNHLWLSSNYGIMQFNKETYKVRTFLEKDGLTHHEFNRSSAFQSADGTIYFGGLDGLTVFNPDDFYDDETSVHPPMRLSSYRKFSGTEGKEVDLTGQLNTTGEIFFRPNDRYLRLKFALLTYEASERLNYAYQLSGVDDSWNYQTDNTLQLGKLPYGTHQLTIKGQENSGEWSPIQLAYTVHVIKPVYLRTWFLIGSVLLLLGVVYLFLRERTRTLGKEIARATATIKKQSEELRQLDELKSRFFANVSHELRTPLSLMLGPIKRLRKQQVANPEEQQKLLGFLERNTLHLRELVNEILDLSKLENNKLELNKQPTLFLEYLNTHLSQFYSIGGSESVLVTSNLQVAPTLAILLDQNRFEKIINNFLSNAIKFTPSSGQVDFSVLEEKESFLISVKDNGKGISPEDLPYVFDRFFQSKDKDAPTEGGTGIGLSMSKELAELMGGNVWAESSLGNGSVFYFRLPKEISHAPASAPPPNITTDSDMANEVDLYAVPVDTIPATLGKHILIVEDNPDLRAYYQILLSDYQVSLTENGQQALNYLAKGNLPDLIISDLMMPIMDGMQLLGQLKSDDRYRHLPVIMLTAKTNQQVKIEALRYGIDDYLNKPFDDDELRIRIANLLARQAARRDFLAEEIVENGSPQLGAADLTWLQGVEAYILERLDNPDLSVRLLSKEFAMSESTLLRQTKRLTGMTPNKYIQEIRLNQAREYLLSKEYPSVGQVAYEVGFKDQAAFSRSFRKRFGKAPTSIMA